MLDREEFLFYLTEMGVHEALLMEWAERPEATPSELWRSCVEPEWLLGILDSFPDEAFESEAQALLRASGRKRPKPFVQMFETTHKNKKSSEVLTSLHKLIPFERVEQEIEKRLPRVKLIVVLQENNACSAAMDWFNKADPARTLSQLWAACEHGLWLEWLLEIVELPSFYAASEEAREEVVKAVHDVGVLDADRLAWVRHGLTMGDGVGDLLSLMDDDGDITLAQQDQVDALLAPIVRKYVPFEEVWLKVEAEWRRLMEEENGNG